MKKLGIFVIVLIVMSVVACILPNQISSPQASLASHKGYMLAAPPGSSPTPTPFQPIPPTPTYIPTVIVPKPTATAVLPTPYPTMPAVETNFVSAQGRSWADYPGPSVWPDMEIPAPMGI